MSRQQLRSSCVAPLQSSQVCVGWDFESVAHLQVSDQNLPVLWLHLLYDHDQLHKLTYIRNDVLPFRPYNGNRGHGLRLSTTGEEEVRNPRLAARALTLRTAGPSHELHDTRDARKQAERTNLQDLSRQIRRLANAIRHRALTACAINL